MIEVKGLHKAFGQFVVIDDLTLSISAGEIGCLVAPSGAGKTTLLRIIAGLEVKSRGIVLANAKEVVRPSPEIGLVPQSESVFPFLTVRGNLRFGLRLSANHERSSSSAEKLIRQMCTSLGLATLEDRYPSQLSGGQRQRVVLGRALILHPPVLLCDEPFSAVDEITRQSLRELLLDLHSQYSPTILFVTHDVEEAVFLARRIWVLAGPPLRTVRVFENEFRGARTREWLSSVECRKLCEDVSETVWSNAAL